MGAAEDKPNGRRLSRRRFLIVGGAGVASAGLAARYPAVFAAAAQEPSFALDLVRREDMAVLAFDFHNLTLSTAGTPSLVRLDTTQPSLVVVRFGSQHLMEEPLEWEDGEPDPLPAVGEIATRAVSESRIAFVVPQTVKSLPFTEDGLFGWWQWVPKVHPRAIPLGGRLPDEDDPNVPPPNTKPQDDETDLLLVDYVHLSPDAFSTWLHSPRPVTRGERTELWHTVLRPRNEDGRPDTSRAIPWVRAVSADKAVDLDPDGVFTVMRPEEFDTAPEQIVDATTRFALDNDNDPGKKFVQPVAANLLLLSSVGSSVDLAGNWLPVEAGYSIAKWLHKSTLGRDNYVRLEKYGYLFPFGNRAVFVIETQRRIASNGAAFLFQRRFIVVREPIKTFPAYGDDTFEGRRFPFKQIQLTTLVTPDFPPVADLEAAGIYYLPGSGNASMWVPTRDPITDEINDLAFPVVATDWEGNVVQFSCSLAFIDKAQATAPAPPPWTMPGLSVPLPRLIGEYANYETLIEPSELIAQRRTVALSGQSVAFAEPLEPGDTAFPVANLYLGAYGDTSPDAGELGQLDLPNFYPSMLGAHVRLPSVEALVGPGATSLIGYDKTFAETPKTKAAEDNVADTFVRVQQDIDSLGKVLHHLDDPNAPLPGFASELGVAFNDAGKEVGGVALPNLNVGALSRKFGPLSGSVQGISDMVDGSFSPSDFFPESATLLGGITLRDIIEAIPLSTEGGGGPVIVTRTEFGNGDNEPPTAVVVTFDWAPTLFGEDPAPEGTLPHVASFVPYGVDKKHATLTLHGELRTVFGGETSSKIKGDLRDFTLDLIVPEDGLTFIVLTFNRFTFEQHNDAKPTFDPDIAKVEFKGPLSFINTLQKYLSPGSSSGSNALSPKAAGAVVPLAGPTVDVQPTGVTLGYTLEIPTVSVGVFSLQNMSFSAGLTLPFNGDLVSATFGFASPENRFVVSVYIFGGGGYFALELTTKGLKRVEAAIEFGGVLALSIVIASGSLSVMAGIYFKLEIDQDTGEEEVTLTGYLRAVGRLSVLGLITITAEFYLALEYKSVDNSVEGIAILKVTVEVAFFSKTVELEVRKKFAGPEGSGKRALAAGQHEFSDLMSQSDWNMYVDSFAA